MHRVRPLRLVPVRVPRLGVQRLDRQREPPHDLEQAEGWEAAVLKLEYMEERLKMARTAMGD